MSAIYEFDWDAAKAEANARKHSVTFESAMTVFRDPLALTIYDIEHSEQEERWVTIGRAENGTTVLVVHTFTPTISGGNALIRIISAREATNKERQQYEAG